MKKPMLVLSYHHLVEDSVEGISPLQSVYMVTKEKFLAQMNVIRESGLEVLPYEALFQPPVNSKPAIILTFDDGNPSDYSIAKPILESYGFPWTIFLSLHTIQESLNWSHLSELNQLGVHIGLHGSIHSDYTLLTKDAAEKDLLNCRNEVQKQLGIHSKDFALPFGRYNQSTLRMLHRNGIRAAATTRFGWNYANSGEFLIRRWAIRRATTDKHFQAILQQKSLSNLRLQISSSIRHSIMQLIGSRISNLINIFFNAIKQ